jgi:uncharacterized protein (DUF1330 family)
MENWMKSYCAVAFGVLGIFAGTAGTTLLQAATEEPAAYLVANIQSVKDQAQYDRYRGAVAGTQAPYGGRFLVRGAMPVMLGNSAVPQGTVVIIRFPSMKNLQDWWNSPAYSAIRPLRESGTVSRLFAAEGLPGS